MAALPHSTRREFLRTSAGALTAGTLAAGTLAAGTLAATALQTTLAAADEAATPDAANNDPAKPDTTDIAVTGVEQPQLASIDRLMREFMQTQRAAGAGVAIAKDGRLVYARGFGLADREKNEPVQPNALFRIASISKPVTAVAVMHLVEQKKLDLDAKICQVLGLSETKDARWQQITLRNLLQHTGGWDRDQSFDAMFRSVKIAETLNVPPPAMPEHIIRYMCEQPLDFDPGTRYAYSNFGYSLLGRAMERVTGVKYDEYVRREVLAPMGIGGMRLGYTPLEQRAEREVRYYDRRDHKGPAVVGKIGEDVPVAYGAWCIEAMDSHGGWIASPVDLVRFASSLKLSGGCPVLEPNSIATMFSPPPGKVGLTKEGEPRKNYYSCGWNTRPQDDNFTAWHNGALDGTSTILVRRYDGLCWSVLFNMRTTRDGQQLAGTIDPPFHKAVAEIKEWPAGDLFKDLL